MKRSVLAVAALIAATLFHPMGSVAAAESVDFQRYGGETRYETAAAIAVRTFSSASEVVLARGDKFPDALASSSLAGDLAGPVLLTTSDRLHPVVLETLETLGTSRVHIVGDESAVSASVESALRRGGYATTRTAGATRYDTATAIAQRNTTTPTAPGRGRTVLLASGETFADALAVAPVSYATQLPLLLTTKNTLPETTEQYLRSRSIDAVVIVGGSGVITPAVESRLVELGVRHERLAGADRTATASAVAWWTRDVLGWSLDHLNLARGDRFADAVAAGPHAGQEQAPLLLAASPAVLGPATEDVFGSAATTLTSIHVFGDQGAVSDETLEGAKAAGTSADRCASTAFPLQYKDMPDPRVCLTMTLDGHHMKVGQGTVTATLQAANRSDETVDITHPTSCAVWYGLFAPSGKLIAGGQSYCATGPYPDALAPHEVRTWTVEIHSCYGRSGDTGSDCFEGAAVTGAFHAAVGLNTGTAPNVNADEVWYAPTQPLFVAP